MNPDRRSVGHLFGVALKQATRILVGVLAGMTQDLSGCMSSICMGKGKTWKEKQYCSGCTTFFWGEVLAWKEFVASYSVLWPKKFVVKEAIQEFYCRESKVCRRVGWEL